MKPHRSVWGEVKRLSRGRALGPSLSAFLLSVVVAATAPAQQPVELFLDRDTSGSTAQFAERQRAQETLFIQSIGATTLVDFDDRPPAGSCVEVSGREWAGSGIVFSQPAGFGLCLYGASENLQPHSMPNCLFPGDPGYRIDERVNIRILSPVTAIGFWLIDSEYNDGNDFIEFVDADEQLIARVPMPFTGTAGHEGDFFIGVVSAIPISVVRVIESPDDNEGVGIDDVRFSEGRRCAADPIIVNVDSIGNCCNPTGVFLQACSYAIIPIGLSEGGAYNAFCAHVGEPSCWVHQYCVSSLEFDTFCSSVKWFTSGTDALAASPTTKFTLWMDGMVFFDVADCCHCCGDNSGGVSLLLVPLATGASQVPGDCNEDAVLDISDAVCVFRTLFTGDPARFPCGDGTSGDPGNKSLLDWDQDGMAVNVSDGIALLQYYFRGGPAHRLAAVGAEDWGCVPLLDCPDACGGGG